MRFAILIGLMFLAGAAACTGDLVEYEVVVPFNTSVTEEDIDEVEGLLASYDDDLEFLIQESWPPTGRAFLETDVPNFCRTVEAELEGRTYVEDVTCERR